MAESEGGGGISGFSVFLVVIFLMAAINYAQTGQIGMQWASISPTYSENTSSSGSGTEPERIKKLLKPGEVLSPYRSRVSLDYYYPNQDPNSEYLQISIKGSSSDLVPITGWRVESDATGRGRPIPKGVILPAAGSINVEQPIYVRGGDRIVLVSGRSPTGYSFRVNSCTGYFAHFQNFYPSIQSECRRPETYKLPARPNHLNDQCLDYLDSLPTCFLPTGTIPQYLSKECQNFVADNYNYNSCLLGSKDQPGFYKNEWRVYLNSGEGLWKSRRETIRILDAENRLVTSVSY
ncbi:MAG TPA: hypothetical protein VD967_00475 [Candidatus Paceibacterota bacterium]|nr:hypothetical protein [Candidatus Paceibacterota bacterium]